MSNNGAAAVPPQNLEAEESVLGAMLVSAGPLEDAIESGLSTEDFYRERHREVFRSIVALWDHSAAVDAITVSEHLAARGKLAEVGGREAVSHLASVVPVPGNAKHYAEIVVEHGRLRRLLAMSHRIQAAVNERAGDSEALLDEAERLLLGMSGPEGEALSHIGAALDELADELDAIRRGEPPTIGVSTGYGDLDRVSGGLDEGELVIVAGRPSMGKTSLAMELTANVAGAIGAGCVGFFSAEMNRKELVRRLALSRARITSEDWRAGKISEAQARRFLEESNRLDALPIYVDETTPMGMRHIRARARRLAARQAGGVRLVVVDYLQLLVPDQQRREANRVQEVAEITRAMKLLARELDCCVVGLSQLSRRCEERVDKRPLLSDLRESGEIEQAADVVLMLYRDDYYNEDSEDAGICEVNVAKHRDGPTGTVKLVWREEYTRFDQLARAA
ncbi:MAG: replicative DNA helicase [Solirubrobacterales bacterium]